MFEWVLGNTLVAALFALVAASVSRLQSTRPALSHLLWMMSLAALMMPRIPGLDTPGNALRRRAQALVVPAGVPDVTHTASMLAPDLGLPDPNSVGKLAVGRVDPSGKPKPEMPIRSWLPSLPVASWLPVAWLVGALIVLSRSAVRVLPFQRHVQSSAQAPAALQLEVEQVARRFGLRAPVVRLLPGIVSPSIWCLGRPLLLWPSNSDSSNTSTARSTLIAHELAHLARRDHWVSWLDVPASALFWWNPLFWLIRGRIRHFAELSCDAWAVWAYPVDRRAFAEALINLQARTATVPIPAQGLGATDSEFKDFERRLNMIMKKSVFHGVSKGAIAVALLASLLASPGLTDGIHGGKKKRAAGYKSTTPAAIQAHVEVAHMMKKAEALFAKENHEHASAVFAEVLEIDPDNGRARECMGHILLKRGEFERAAKQFEQQFKAGYSASKALYNLACASSLAGEYETALKALEHAVGHGFANIDLLAIDSDLDGIRGDALFQELIDRAAAGKALKAGIVAAQETRDDDLYRNLHGELARVLSFDGGILSKQGHLAMKAGELEEAAWAFARQAEVGYQVGNGNYNLACALARMGKIERSLEVLGKARDAGMGYEAIRQDSDLDSLRSDSRFAELQERIAACGAEREQLQKLLKAGSAAEALPRLKKMVGDADRSSKERGWAIHALGRELFSLGRLDDALAAFEHAAEQGHGLDRSAFHQAQVLSAMGKEESALRHMQYAVELGFDDAQSIRQVLATNSQCSPEELANLVEGASKAKKKAYGKKAYGKKSGVAVKKELAASGAR